TDRRAPGLDRGCDSGRGDHGPARGPQSLRRGRGRGARAPRTHGVARLLERPGGDRTRFSFESAASRRHAGHGTRGVFGRSRASRRRRLAVLRGAPRSSHQDARLSREPRRGRGGAVRIWSGARSRHRIGARSGARRAHRRVRRADARGGARASRGLLQDGAAALHAAVAHRGPHGAAAHHERQARSARGARVVIDTALLDLLRPLEEFEEIRRRAARLGDRLCDLSYANPYEGVQLGTRDVLRHALDAERLLDLQYTPFGGHTLTRRAVADDLSERQRIPYAFDDVVLTPGAMAALQLALRTAASPGTDVIIPVPCWLDYPLYALHLGLNPVTVALRAPEFLLDVTAIEAAITERTSAILLSNPSNPAGRSYPEDALAQLSTVITRAARRIGKPITLISDETHRDFTDAA